MKKSQRRDGFGMGSFFGAGRFCSEAVLAALFHRAASALAVEKFGEAGEIPRGGNVRAVKTQFAIFHFRPNAASRLNHAKKAGLSARFQRGDRRANGPA